ncbi:uncharacterized protein METZ01_LOCUS261752, partial [marine metagenome]
MENKVKTPFSTGFFYIILRTNCNLRFINSCKFTGQELLTLITISGEVAEWLKAHAWKACKR